MDNINTKNKKAESIAKKVLEIGKKIHKKISHKKQSIKEELGVYRLSEMTGLQCKGRRNIGIWVP